jgi:hypothetical protein
MACGEANFLKMSNTIAWRSVYIAVGHIMTYMRGGPGDIGTALV